MPEAAACSYLWSFARVVRRNGRRAMRSEGPGQHDHAVHTPTEVRASSLTRNATINFLGGASPLLLAFLVLPVLTRSLGPDRFGILTLTWVFLGYFSLFDLGLGRAVTKLVAEKIGRREEEKIAALVWNSIGMMLAMGVVGSLVAFAAAPYLMREVLEIPAPLQPESLQSFYLLAISIPVVTITAGFRGVLEATQRFDLVNLLRIPIATFTFLSPLAVLPFSHNLVPMVGMLLLGRVVALIAHLLVCFRVVPSLRAVPVLDLSAIKSLLGFGTWISVSNVIGPLMVSLDRFVIGAMISVAAVAYYTAPYEAVTKLWLIPGALTGVLFPAFATAWARGGEEVVHLLRQGVKYTFLVLFPIILVIVTFGHEGLALWLGNDYAENSTRVLQWLAIGVFLNCLGHIPFALIQAVGRPDMTAKLHLLELPFYLLALWWLIGRLGIEGVAIAWSARCLVDTVGMFVAARSLISSHSLQLRWLTLGTLSMVGLGALSLFTSALLVRVMLLVVTLPVFGVVAWYGMLSAEERSKWRAYAKS